jgi:tellurite resistance protein
MLLFTAKIFEIYRNSSTIESMIREFDKLNTAEIELLHQAPVLVSILIAGADGKIDNKEVKRAISLTEAKQKRTRSRLMEFYAEVGTDFEDKIRIMIQSLPSKVDKRTAEISKTLQQLEPILKKVNIQIAKEFYQSLREIATEIAESSGGVLGLKTIGDEEALLVSLPMIKDPATF